MIETPRVALMAGTLGRAVDFVSFGTNDLTQFTWALSRDDANLAFEDAYRSAGVWSANPFESLDQLGVGALIETAIGQLRAVSPATAIGACGEHCADPVSASWLVAAGVDSLSVAPHALAPLREELAGAAGITGTTGTTGTTGYAPPASQGAP
jgi:pyruvate,orthophosphate dikinase